MRNADFKTEDDRVAGFAVKGLIQRPDAATGAAAIDNRAHSSKVQKVAERLAERPQTRSAACFDRVGLLTAMQRSSDRRVSSTATARKFQLISRSTLS